MYQNWSCRNNEQTDLGFHLQHTSLQLTKQYYTAVIRGSRGGEGRGPDPLPLRNHKFIGFFLAVLVRVPCKTTKLTSKYLVLDHHRPASETSFKWRFAWGAMLAPL